MEAHTDRYFLHLALRLVPPSGDCRQVGCVLVKNHRVLTTGVFVQSLSNRRHRTPFSPIPPRQRTAATQVLRRAMEMGESVEGCTVYLTSAPSLQCVQALEQAGIRRFVVAGDSLPPSYDEEDLPAWIEPLAPLSEGDA